MPARNKAKTPVPFGMSNKQMKRKKPINLDFIKKIEPLTANQEEFFRSYKLDQNLVDLWLCRHRQNIYSTLQCD